MDNKNDFYNIQKYSLTSYQKDIWLKQIINPDNPLCNIGASVEISGNINYEKLNLAVKKAIMENDILRLQIREENGDVYQYFLPEIDYSLPYYDFSNSDITKQHIDDWMQNRLLVLFDLKKQLFDFVLIKINDNLHYWFFKAHHVIADGWALTQLIHKITEDYNYITQSYDDIELNSFITLIEKDKKYLSSERYKKSIDFWKEEYADIPEHIFSYKNNSDPSEITSMRYKHTIERSKYNRIIELCNTINCSEFHFFLALLSLYFCRLYNKDEIVIGVPILNRNKREMDIIGHCVNTIPLRIRVNNSDTFLELVNHIEVKLFKCYRHSQLSYGQIYRELKLHDKDLFDISLSFDIHNTKFNFGCHWSNTELLSHLHEEKALFMLVHAANANEDAILYLDYLLEIFNGKLPIEQVVSHFEMIINDTLKSTEKKIKDIDILTSEEKQKFIVEWNDTKADYPKDKCIHQLFEEQVERTPNNIAVVFEGSELTYRELNENANRMAHYLQSKGVKPEILVGICVDRSFEMIIGLFGILKAGGAYIPIDPNYPEDRIAYMVSDSNCGIILTQESIKSELPENNSEIVCLDTDLDKIKKESCENLFSEVKSDNLVYTIYTSGSTGKPKGTLIEHGSLVNRINWMQKNYSIGEDDSILQKTTFTFDVSVWELFWWSLYGAKVCFLKPGDEKDPEAIVKCIEANRITTIHFVPSMYTSFLQQINNKKSCEELISLKQIFCSGEELQVKHVECSESLINENGTKLINLYGPTEATIDVTYFNCSVYDESVPIGKPIFNTQVYILDKFLNLVPVGVPGELHVAGDGLSRGYLNRLKLTGERFIHNPFCDDHLSRLYKTGDLVKYLPDGNIEFIGRIDNQVKIRGFRIELGEIEFAIKNLENVKEVVLTAKEDSNFNKQLVAYIVTDINISLEEIRVELSKLLPDYMVPSCFIQIDEIPLTENGKIDRKKLVDLNGQIIIGAEYIEPRTKNEIGLASIWTEVLNIGHIGVKDNFFHIGGNSITAIQVFNKLSKTFDLSLTDIFKYPTINSFLISVSQKRSLRGKLQDLYDNYSLKKSPKSETVYSYDYSVLLEKSNKQELVFRTCNNIFITGATGYLGVYCVREYLLNSNLNIYLLVRAESQDKGIEKFLKNYIYYFSKKEFETYQNRIVVIPGDGSQKRFGLMEETYNKLLNNIDVLVNSAAKVQHYGQYDDFYASNIKMVENIIQFCTYGKQKRLVHISTIGVALVKNEESNNVFDEFACIQNVEKNENYYIKSKAIAENLIISNKNLSDFIIVRVGNIVFDSEKGHLQKNIGANAFMEKIRSLLKFGFVPEGLIGLEYSFVNQVACSINILSSISKHLHKIYHVFNDDIYLLDDVLKEIELYKVEIVPEKCFIKKIIEAYDHGESEEINALLIHGNMNGIEYPEIVNDYTKTVLSRRGFEWGKIDMDRQVVQINKILQVNKS